MSTNLYSSEALCALINSGKVRLPLSLTRSLDVLAKLEHVADWNTIAHRVDAPLLKQRAAVLRQVINQNLVGGKISELAAIHAIERALEVPNPSDMPVAETPPTRPALVTSPIRPLRYSDEFYKEMGATASGQWEEAIDWVAIVTAQLEEPGIASSQNPAILDLRKLLPELSPRRLPTELQVQRLKKIQQALLPSPSRELLSEFGGANLEQKLDLLVQVHGGRAQAVRLRRASLAYQYLSFLISALGSSAHAL